MKRFAILLVFCIVGIMSFAQRYDITSLKSKAEQGDAEAQFTLCHYYAKGIGVNRDNTMALNYLLLAAENNYPEALYELGCCYKDGALGLPVWKEKAKDYLSRACELGYSKATESLGELTKDYKPFRRGIRRSVYKQTISIAPQSQVTSFKSNRSKFMGQ